MHRVSYCQQPVWLSFIIHSTFICWRRLVKCGWHVADWFMKNHCDCLSHRLKRVKVVKLLIYYRAIWQNSTLVSHSCMTFGRVLCKRWLFPVWSIWKLAFRLLLAWHFWLVSLRCKVSTFNYYHRKSFTLVETFFFYLAWIGKRSGHLRTKTTERTDFRVKIMNEILFGIQVIKMYAWEKSFAQIVDRIRK